MGAAARPDKSIGNCAMNPADHCAIALSLVSSLRRSKWDRSAIADYQARALVKMMRHAVTHVPYYRRLGLTPNKVRSLDDLDRFPVITKATIQEFNDNLIADGFDQTILESSVTSGSTGEPTTTYFDRASWLHGRYTLKIKRMVENGVGLFSRIIVASEYAPDALKAGRIGRLPGDGLFFQQRRISVHESPAAHVDVFKSFKPDALYAFPSYLSELVDYCEEQSIRLPNARVVFTSSEVLTSQLRKRIEEFFGGRVCDIYGSTELKEVAWQCERGRYHINFESVYVEPVVADEGGPASLVLSTLRNRAMPLLRFRIGDFGKLEHGVCSCGRQSPYIDAISGREVDVLELPSGRRVLPWVLITHSIERTPEISRYQFVQTDSDRLEIRVILRADGRKIEELQPIAKEVAARLDGEVDVKLVEVEHIPRTKGGKHRVLMRPGMEPMR